MVKKNRRVNKKIKQKKDTQPYKIKDNLTIFFKKTFALCKSTMVVISPFIIKLTIQIRKKIVDYSKIILIHLKKLHLQKRAIKLSHWGFTNAKRTMLYTYKIAKNTSIKIISRKPPAIDENTSIPFDRSDDLKTEDNTPETDYSFKLLFTNILFSCRSNLKKISIKKVIEYFNPRTVRLETPKRHFVHTSIISIFFISVSIIAGAVASGADKNLELLQKSSTNKKESVENSDGIENSDAIKNSDKIIKTVPSKSLTGKKAPKESNFHDPLYIFTDEPSKSHTAYPLADPPGIVVTIAGTSTPDDSPEQMVGNDKRIKSIKRISTRNGLRYIIWLNSPVKRIESSNEGNVISISPLK